MNSDFKELLKIFGEEKVKYLIIGGYAVGKHAEPRRSNWKKSGSGIIFGHFRLLPAQSAGISSGLMERKTVRRFLALFSSEVFGTSGSVSP